MREEISKIRIGNPSELSTLDKLLIQSKVTGRSSLKRYRARCHGTGIFGILEFRQASHRTGGFLRNQSYLTQCLNLVIEQWNGM